MRFKGRRGVRRIYHALMNHHAFSPSCIAVDVLSLMASRIGSFLKFEDRRRFSEAHPALRDAHCENTYQEWNVRCAADFVRDVGPRKMPALLLRKPRLTELSVAFEDDATADCIAALRAACPDRVTVTVISKSGTTTRCLAGIPAHWRVEVIVQLSEDVDAAVELAAHGHLHEVQVATQDDAARLVSNVVAHGRSIGFLTVGSVGMWQLQPGELRRQVVTDEDLVVASSLIPRVRAVHLGVTWSWMAEPGPLTRIATEVLVDLTVLYRNMQPYFSFLREKCPRLNVLRIVSASPSTLLAAYGPSSHGGHAPAELADTLRCMHRAATSGAILMFEQFAVTDPSVVPLVRQVVRRLGPDEDRLPCGCASRRVAIGVVGKPGHELCARLAALHLVGTAVAVRVTNDLGADCACKYAQKETLPYEALLEELRCEAPELHAMWERIRPPKIAPPGIPRRCAHRVVHGG